MPSTFAELLTPVTETEAEELILALLEAVGFPATAWKRFSVPRTFVKLFGRLYMDVRTGITNIAKSRLLDYAERDALTYLALYFFEVVRALATATVGTMVLADDGGAPYTIAIGQLLVQDTATGHRFTNTTGGTLASGGTLSLTFRAVGTGAEYNIGTGVALEFAESLAGVTITNPAVGATGTWIITTGTDEQTDASVREQCRAKWATVGAGTEDAYEAWAIEGEPTITKVKVLGSETEGAGGVRVLLATDAGEPSATQVANANTNIQLKRPIGLRSVTVLGASAVPVVIAGTVNVYSGASTYATALATALQQVQADVQIAEDFYLTRITALLHSPGNVRDVVLTSPITNQGIDVDQIATLSLGTITVNTVT